MLSNMATARIAIKHGVRGFSSAIVTACAAGAQAIAEAYRLIAEDSAILRDGLTFLLRDRGHRVVAAVPDGVALLTEVAARPPDVCVVAWEILPLDVRGVRDGVQDEVRNVVSKIRTGGTRSTG